jgi:hypothetical protein
MLCAGERSDVLAGLVPASPSAVTSGTPKSLDAYRTQQADKDKPDYQWLVPTPPLHHPTCLLLCVTCCAYLVSVLRTVNFDRFQQADTVTAAVTCWHCPWHGQTRLPQC